MAIDAAPLAQLVASFMDDMEQEFGEDAVLEDAVVAIEVLTRNEDGEEVSTVEACSIGKRNTAAIGISIRALDAMRTIDPWD